MPGLDPEPVNLLHLTQDFNLGCPGTARVAEVTVPMQ